MNDFFGTNGGHPLELQISQDCKNESRIVGAVGDRPMNTQTTQELENETRN